MRSVPLLGALVLALGLALAPAALAQQGRSAPPKVTAAEARYDTAKQAGLVRKQIEALPPQRPGVTDIYVIGLAGWSTDVFRNELDGALAVAGKALPLAGTVRLINSRETVETVPLATRKNFRAAVQGVAGVMDRSEDVLFLFMTSHGGKEGIGLQLPRLLVPLVPKEVAGVLNRAGIRNRVVIVSACYSGIFVKPLANDNTIVLTAADTKHTSFGCAEGRQWTYFGDAFFQQSLKPGTDFEDAYAQSRKLIAAWEKKEQIEPSNPQGFFGRALTRKLAPLFEAKAGQSQ
jgi:hypothetical protein